MTNCKSKMGDLFEFQVLAKILGPLNYQVLKILKDELKSNAACIDINLGGGANGHLGLILTAIKYSLVSTTPYVRYTMPTAPSIDSKTKTHESIRMQDDCKEDKALYKEMVALEKFLLKKLNESVPAMYLKEFQNKHSNALNKPISEILEHLFTIYGRVPQEVIDKEDSKLQANFSTFLNLW